MPIIFYCQQCFERVTTPNETAGKTGRCPFCGEMMDIPEIPDAATQGAAGQGSAPASPPTTSLPAAQSTADEDLFEARDRQKAWGKNIKYGEDTAQPDISKSLTDRFQGTPEQRTAKARTRMPGICLLIASLSGIVAGICVLLVILIPAAAAGEESLSSTKIAFIVVAGVSCIVESIILVGVVDMIKADNWRAAKTSALGAVAPISAWFPITLPFGVWAMIVLAKQDVKKGFTVRPSNV